VFGGRGKQGLVKSIEVFDTHREIWRQFRNEEDDVNTIKRTCFETISLVNNKIIEDKIYIVGGLN